MILALSCSSAVGSLCVFDGKNILETRTWKSERSHAEFVSKKLSDVTEQYPFAQIQALAVDVGPGSFTGIRIAVNTIKTLSYATGLPIVTANSLEILAGQVPESEDPIVCLVDAFSQSAYAATFRYTAGSWNAKDLPTVVKSSELKNLFKSKSLCLGDGFEKYVADLEEVKSFLMFEKQYSNFPSSEVLAKIAFEKLQKKSFTSWEKLEPLYIRRSSAEEKLLV